MKSKDLINYLESIDANVTNKHQEFKKELYNLSVVLFKISTTTSDTEEIQYKVCILANKDESNTTWGNISCQFFDSERKANTYYNKLIEFVSSASIDEIKNLLHDN